MTPAGADVEAGRLSALLGHEPTLADFTDLDRPALAFGIYARPRASGRLPDFSASWHPAHLPRVADPADPLGSTHDEAFDRLRTERAAQILTAAIPAATSGHPHRTPPARLVTRLAEDSAARFTAALQPWTDPDDEGR